MSTNFQISSRPRNWESMLTTTPIVSPLIVRTFLDPVTLKKISGISRQFHQIAKAEWNYIKAKPCNLMVAKQSLDLLWTYFLRGELNNSPERFEFNPMNPKHQKIVRLGLLLDELQIPMTETFDLNEGLAILKMIKSPVICSLAYKAIDFEKYQKNIPPAVTKAMNLISDNTVSLIGKFIAGSSVHESISKDRVSRGTPNKDLFKAMPQNVLNRVLTGGHFDPKALTRMSCTSRYFRMQVNHGWKYVTNRECIRFVVARKVNSVMFSLGLEEIIKKEAVKFLQNQKGMISIFSKICSLFVKQIPNEHWENLVKAVSDITLPYLIEIIPFTMEESIALVKFAHSRIGKSIIKKFLPLGFKIDELAFRFFCSPNLQLT